MFSHNEGKLDHIKFPLILSSNISAKVNEPGAFNRQNSLKFHIGYTGTH